MLRILIADDEPIEHKILGRIIQHSKLPAMIVDTAKTGSETIELFEKHMPDLIFMDIRMPGLSGLDVSGMIKSKQPSTIIAIITAFDEFQYAKRAIDLHIDYFLLKPVEPDEVERIIQETLQTKSPSLTQSAESHPRAKLSPNRVQLAEKMMKYLHKEYATPITLADLETEFHFSSQYLSRTFKEAYRMSIMNYLTRLRVEIACKLLTNSEISISLVAEKVGIGDISYFGQMFKQAKGVTPSQYRQQYFLHAEGNSVDS